MVLKLLKKPTSIALAFAVVLSLSCCGVGDEILIDDPPTETASEAAETTSEATEEATTEEATETTPEETEEVTTEAITISISDETEETILASLTDEEKEVWLSMPDIVTMRVLSRYDEEEEEIYTEFLYNEIIYIDKMGQVKNFISYEELKTNDDDEYIEWLNGQISQNEDAEITNMADIHTLIKFYNAFMCINSNHKWASNHTVGLAVEIKRHYGFSIFGTRNNLENGLETLSISRGNAGDYRVPRNYTDEGEQLDTFGRKTFNLYLQLDPFMVDEGGGLGHLVGEEG